jgi:cell division protease FtsH
LRPGRFDRTIVVDSPDAKGREGILKVHARKVKTADDVSLSVVARGTPGMTGADLANLVNEAALSATSRAATEVALEDFTRAVERIIAGLEKKNRVHNPKEREVVAYHEMGHALTALALPGTDPVHQVSIIPRGIGAPRWRCRFTGTTTWPPCNGTSARSATTRRRRISIRIPSCPRLASVEAGAAHRYTGRR